MWGQPESKGYANLAVKWWVSPAPRLELQILHGTRQHHRQAQTKLQTKASASSNGVVNPLKTPVAKVNSAEPWAFAI